MNDVKWIKIDTSLFDNRKIKQIRTLPEGDSLIVIWLQLLCLAGTVNDYGRIYLTSEIPYTDQMLSTAFNEPLRTIQMALDVFQKFGMIEVVDDIILISNWEKYQSIEGLEKVREQAKIRMRNYRERQREGISYKDERCNVTLRNKLRDVTLQNKKENKNIKKEILKKEKRSKLPDFELLEYNKEQDFDELREKLYGKK